MHVGVMVAVRSSAEEVGFGLLVLLEACPQSGMQEGGLVSRAQAGPWER